MNETITLVFTNQQLRQICGESVSFRNMVADQFFKSTTIIENGVVDPYPHSKALMTALTHQIKKSYSFNSRLAAIKAVRQFASDNFENLNSIDHHSIASFTNAMSFVDRLLK